MTTWMEFPHALAPRVQETEQKLGAVLMRFDNRLYLRVEGSGSGLRPFAELRFALFQGQDGSILSIPLIDAAPHIAGGRGYRFTDITGLPLVSRRLNAGIVANAGSLKTILEVKRAQILLSAAVHPERLEVGAPLRHARAIVFADGERAGFRQQADYSHIAERILKSLDEVKRLLTESIALSQLRDSR